MTCPTPQRKRTGLIVGALLAAAVVVAFVVTGFVAPGFLNGPPSAGQDIDAWADRLAAAINERDTAAVVDMTCADSPGVSVDLIEGMTDDTSAEAAGTERDGDRYRVKIELTDGATVDALYAGVTKNGAGFCWATTDIVVAS